MTASEAVRLARCYLSTVAEPPAPALASFVERHGPVVAAERVRRAEVPERVAAETVARRGADRAASYLAAAHAIGARLLVPEDADWPTAAFHAFALCGHDHLAPPLALWLLGNGDLAALAERSVAIVGSRAASDYGERVANTLGHGVGEHGFTVVSGAAYGIDAAAHRGALAAGAPTVAVLARGVDQPYPVVHERLLREIAESGLVISEYPPGAPPARHRFLVRNRIIAGLSAGTVVVEAGWRSGSRRTASDATLLGRSVMAVPGPVTSALSVGCHRLLREPGTVAVTRAEEVVEEVGRIGLDLAPSGGPAPDGCLAGSAAPIRVAVRRPTDALTSTAFRVHEALDGRGARDQRRLSFESGLPPELVREALAELVRAGLAQPVEGGWERCDRRGGRGGA